MKNHWKVITALAVLIAVGLVLLTPILLTKTPEVMMVDSAAVIKSIDSAVVVQTDSTSVEIDTIK